MEKEYNNLYSGTYVTKISSSGKGQRRFIFVDYEGDSLVWKSKRKNTAKSRVKFADVTRILLGQTTRRFQKYKRPQHAEFSLSIHYKVANGDSAPEVVDSFDVVFENKQTLDIWHRNIIMFRDLHAGIIVNRNLVDDNTKLAIREWQRAPKSAHGRLSSAELQQVFKTINSAWSESEIKEKLKKHDENGDNSLDFNEFLTFFSMLCLSEDVTKIYDKYFQKDISAEECLVRLQQFCQTELQDYIELPQLKQKLREMNIPYEKEFLCQHFSTFLLSDFNSILAPYAKEISHDMTQPLAHYFINSSHNTYLEGDQLASNSSVEMYKMSLLLGCRCVELDCWDGNGDGEPIIYHGHTMTSKILFRDVIQTCKEYAFASSEYPVILSLENHCNIEHQIQMARILRTILGDALANSLVGESVDHLESPALLKRKFLIKGSTLPMNEILLAKGKIAPPTDSTPLNPQDESDDEDDDESQADAASGSTRKTKAAEAKKPKAKVAAELSEKVYLKNTKFVDFSTSQAKGRPYEMSSFAEKKTESLCKSQGAEFIAYNRRQLSRIYPGGHRVDSSNYDPSPAWSRGCQIVALNFQTPATPMFLNLGKFRENGNTGYLLKPDYMLRGNYDPLVKKEPVVNVQVTIVSGFRLPKPNQSRKGEVIDPYVKLIVQGHPDDEFENKTRTINDNGWNPSWNESFDFKVTRTHEAVVVFAVYDKDVNRDDFIGYYSLPLNSMRRGLRFVPLHSKDHQPIPGAGLLCAIQTHSAA